ncbi:MAG: hypothetical protein PVJ57_06885, partial [Phycisphaerae bacterium]
RRYSRASAYSSAQRGRLGTNLDPESTPPFFIPPSTKFGYSSTSLAELDNDTLQQIKELRDFRKWLRAEGKCLDCGFASAKGSVDALDCRLRAHVVDYVDRQPSVHPALPMDLGYVDFFCPDAADVQQRAVKKAACLTVEKRAVRLVAHVGRSYLQEEGHRFRDEVIGLLGRGGTFRLLAQNPWSEIGFMIAVGEADVREGWGSRIVDASRGSPAAMVTAIAKSKYYSTSFCPVMKQYRELRSQYPGLIDCRLSNVDIPVTCMLTSSDGFLEPYLTVDIPGRYRWSMNTFELHFTEECSLYRTASNWFERLWDMSLEYDRFTEAEEDLKQRFMARYRA